MFTSLLLIIIFSYFRLICVLTFKDRSLFLNCFCFEPVPWIIIHFKKILLLSVKFMYSWSIILINEQSSMTLLRHASHCSFTMSCNACTHLYILQHRLLWLHLGNTSLVSQLETPLSSVLCQSLCLMLIVKLTSFVSDVLFCNSLEGKLRIGELFRLLFAVFNSQCVHLHSSYHSDQIFVINPVTPCYNKCFIKVW